MLSKVHWLFLKNGWHLISSTPVRPRRTSLHTATGSRLWAEPPQPEHKTHPPSTHHRHQHVIPNTQPSGVTTRHWPHWPAWRATWPLVDTGTSSSQTDNIDPGGEWEQGQQEATSTTLTDSNTTARAAAAFSPYKLHALSLSFSSPFPPSSNAGYRAGGVRQFGLATCGTFQIQPRGREGRGGEDERGKGEFLNPRKKKMWHATKPGSQQAMSQCPEKMQESKGES